MATTRVIADVRHPGAAALLAERVERLCLAGISRRARGGCEEPGVRPAAHERRGHDACCHALGMPRRSLAWTIAAWDTVGCAPLLNEALDEAIATLADLPGTAWNEGAARDALAFSIRCRIEPWAAEA